jgi:hypothetical protein
LASAVGGGDQKCDKRRNVEGEEAKVNGSGGEIMEGGQVERRLGGGELGEG